jgi:phosphotransferase system HPr-like phosphotransfer protein
LLYTSARALTQANWQKSFTKLFMVNMRANNRLKLAARGRSGAEALRRSRAAA